MLHSPLCELLDIKYPLLQGGMAWVSDASLAGAVSGGGGLGIISAMNAGTDWVRAQIRKIKELTDRPFGVNIMLMSPHAAAIAQLVIEEKVPVITTGAGNPAVYMKDWLNAGIQVLPVVASVALAKLAQRGGAAAVIAEGCEAGGHIGELTTMALVPQVCDAVNIPVIAAGGIADGRGFAAALMLGASGVQMGTRFLVATECTIHQNYKNRVLKAKDIDTIATGKRLGHPVRSLKSPFTRGLFEKEYDANISNEELEALASGSLYKAAAEGDEQNGTFLAGQIAGMITREQPASEIIAEIMREAEIVLGESQKWLK